MRRSTSVILLLALSAGCGTEPSGTLEILLDELPELTTEEDLRFSGTVTRTPPASTTIVVSLTRGSFSAIDTTSESGEFFIDVTLDPNETNDFVLSATDAQGSTSPQVTVSITHDDEPPALSALTPANLAENVPRDQAISFTLSEPVSAPPIVNVRRMGAGHPGTVSTSADGLSITFTPTGQLAAHAIYLVTIGGLEDDAGNSGGTAEACFVTTSGGLTIQSFADPTGGGDQFFQSGAPPSSLLPPDLAGYRFVRDGSQLATLVQYSTARSGDANLSNNVAVWIDLDTDQNAGTGVVAFKDSLIRPVNGTSSGIGADFAIFTTPGQPGEVLDYIDYDNATTTASFQPDFCGVYEGFTIPLSSLGNDDGAFDIATIAFSFGPAGTGALADAGPNDGRYSTVVTGPNPIVSGVRATRADHAADPRMRFPLQLRRLHNMGRN